MPYKLSKKLNTKTFFKIMLEYGVQSVPKVGGRTVLIESEEQLRKILSKKNIKV